MIIKNIVVETKKNSIVNNDHPKTTIGTTVNRTLIRFMEQDLKFESCGNLGLNHTLVYYVLEQAVCKSGRGKLLVNF